jgi:hypothetical protein
MTALPIEDIVGPDFSSPFREGLFVGQSREGREIIGYRLGHGPLQVSLIGGCHADEPVGPAMLNRLVRFLIAEESESPFLRRFSWSVVPHANPDGAVLNRAWSDHTVRVHDYLGDEDEGYDPVLYVQHVVRELPGDDVEFGFPRAVDDHEARPENRAIAEFLRQQAPFLLHGSFHGMGFAPGPWFLLEPAWIERTAAMRPRLRDHVGKMSYPLFDIDRRGEKGFRRIDVGFSTRPDSIAMASHFQALGDDATAGKFRPSSMELVRELGGDPLTLVSEMPLFLLPQEPRDGQGPVFQPGTEGKRQLHAHLQRLATERPAKAARSEFEGLGIRPMPIRDQMRLQLAFLDEALACVAS